jgi:hypothetical protein
MKSVKRPFLRVWCFLLALVLGALGSLTGCKDKAVGGALYGTMQLGNTNVPLHEIYKNSISQEEASE